MLAHGCIRRLCVIEFLHVSRTTSQKIISSYRVHVNNIRWVDGNDDVGKNGLRLNLLSTLSPRIHHLKLLEITSRFGSSEREEHLIGTRENEIES